MAFYITNRIKKIYKDTIEKLRSDIGRVCVILKELDSTQVRDCPNCGRDNVTGKSNATYSPTVPYPSDVVGPFAFKGSCPVCRGEGEVLQQSTTATEVRGKAFIKWIDRFDEEDGSVIENMPVGTLEHATVRLKFNIKYYNDLKKANYLTVDGIKVYRLNNPIRRGLGDVSTCIVYCSENIRYLQSGK